MQFKFPSKNLAMMLLLLGSFMLAYLPVMKSLILAWASSDDYSHGFFILPVCAYIVWQKRERLARIESRPLLMGGVIAVLSLALYLLAYYAEIATLASFSFIIVIGGTIVYLWGFSVFRELLFPLFFMLFMIPVPSQIYSSLTIPLQLLVSQVSTDVASLAGLPVLREGNMIFFPDRTLEVVQACSGLRSIMLLLALSAGFGYLSLKSNFLRAVLLLWAIPSALLVNIIRVMMIILADYYFGCNIAAGTAHNFFGIIIFLLSLALIAGARGVLCRWEKSAA